MNTLVVGFVNGNEGASFFECLYSMYYLIFGAVNSIPDIVNLLKTQQFSFSCLQNPDRLSDLENSFKGASQGTIVNRPKNLKATGSCPPDSVGVNLKFNFAADITSNACTLWYMGSASQSEAETKALTSYISSTSSLGQILLLGNGQYSIDFPYNFYNSTNQGNQNLRFLNSTGASTDYSIYTPSSQISNPSYILNNLASTQNITVIGLDTFSSSVGGTYFIPSTSLSTMVGITNSLILRSACVQGYCPDFLFESFSSNFCEQQLSLNLCSEAQGTDPTKLYGLKFSISNFGQVGKTTDTFVLTLPANYQLISLYRIGAELNLTDSTPTPTISKFYLMSFNDLGQNFVYNYKKYTFNFGQVLPSSMTEFIGIVQTNAVGSGSAFLGISGYENVAQDLSVSTSRIVLKEPTVMIKERTLNFEMRRVSFVILFIYLSLAFIWVLGWAVHLVFGDSSAQPSKPVTIIGQQ